ncbi:Uncharacterised protein [Mycobacteroides abscessus subsp. abscessus]|nr:Uncharacterised protein [Mycobacteroides abscessus subsp. abscessus]
MFEKEGVLSLNFNANPIENQTFVLINLDYVRII